jgi:pimeloyl-ACP methyl ester carboxylesterase
MTLPLHYVYLHGFASGPSSQKAQFLRRRLAAEGVTLEVPNLVSGSFEDLTISGQLAVVDKTVGNRPTVLFGSSLGGYLAALYASKHPQVRALVLLAPALDFACRWAERLGPQAMQEWKRTGWLSVLHYSEGRTARVGYRLYEDALSFDPYPPVDQPTLIFHGTNDDVVPISVAEEFVRRRPNSSRLYALASGHELVDVLDFIWEESRRFLAPLLPTAG